jgi:hypothetical protein
MTPFSYSAYADPVRQLLDEHVAFMSALGSMMEAVDTDVNASSLSHAALAQIELGWSEVNQHLNVHFIKEEEIFFPSIEERTRSAFPLGLVRETYFATVTFCVITVPPAVSIRSV